MNEGAIAPYETLVAKVDTFHDGVAKRRTGDLACKRGCASCCLVELSVSRVEADRIERALAATDDGARRRLGQRLRQARQRNGHEDEPLRCIMLEDDGACVVYGARPLVCRTQGMALRYPPRTFPEQAVMARDDAGSDIVWCPLNFTNAPPRGEDVLEAGRLDEMLVMVNLDHVGGDRDAAVERYPLVELVEAFLDRLPLDTGRGT